MSCYFDLADQLGGDFFHLRLGGVARLGDKIECAQRQSFESGRGAGGGVRADDDDRQLVRAGDLPQGFHAVHTRHIEIERDHVRLELVNLAQCKAAINSGADDFDGLIALQDLRDHLAHERGVIYHQHADFFAHAVAPLSRGEALAGALPSLLTTAAMFRMRTTLPSPRIEAPLTRSVATNWSSKALITNPSSPTSFSTTKPKRCSPMAITMMKNFFCADGWACTCSRSSRSRVRILSRNL